MNTEQPIDSITEENTTENENIGLPEAANVPQKSTNETEEMSLNTVHRPLDNSNPHSHAQEPTFRIEQELSSVPIFQQNNPGIPPKNLKESIEVIRARLN